VSVVFITGASGFMGRRLSAELLRRGHTVRGLVRPGSERRIAAGVEAITGDPLDPATYRRHAGGADTFVHLVGVSHPNPSKAGQFRTIDLASAIHAAGVARASGITHFVYVSVAHPAPVMKEYIAARSEAEESIREAGLNATILRPWYVLGPGRRWPMLLLPAYWLMALFPSTRDPARRLGLVTVAQMTGALAWAVDHPATGVRVMEVPQIRLNRL
jgi:uncharacterized protein YbjT (DUF2867 family)